MPAPEKSAAGGDTPRTSRRREIRRGLQDSWAVGLGLFPLGIAFGLLVVQMGFAWWWAPVFSVVIYAGSMEFLALGMITGGTGWAASAVTGFLVNFRHIFYGLTYPRHRVRNPLAKAYVTYGLIDEVYAITGRFGADGREAGRPVSGVRLTTMALFCQASWVASGVLGALGGSAVTIDLEGLDFALTALFVVLGIEAFRNNRDYSLPLTACALAVAAAWLFPAQMLIVGLVAYFVVLLGRYYSPRLDAVLTLRGSEDPDRPRTREA